MTKYGVGIDIGGTRTKLGIVDLEAGQVVSIKIFNTYQKNESDFLSVLNQEMENCLQGIGMSKTDMLGVGVSIGSYVFEDGTIDGMSCFVPYMVEGYPLLERLEGALGLSVRADNDARLIGLAETRFGVGKGYQRTLTITLGSGVGIGLCVNGRPFGDEAFCHLAGHIKVGSEDVWENLKEKSCYCNIPGCLEGTCSGTALANHLHAIEPGLTNESFFKQAIDGDKKMLGVLNEYLHFLVVGLNQYIYLYCPDIIILGGGVARGLQPFKEEVEKGLHARVHYRHQPVLEFSKLMEDSGVLGAASLFLNT